MPKLCSKGMYCGLGTAYIDTIVGVISSPQPCNPGYYNPYLGQEKCLLCDAGYECPNSGLTVQIECKPGTFRTADRSELNCVNCPEGTYGMYKPGVLNIDASKCFLCPPGTVCISQGVKIDDFKSESKITFNSFR